MNFLTVDWANNWISRCAVAAKEHREALIELDRVIGDADHGENIDRGFSAVLEKLDGQELATPSEVLKITAATLISTVGGASGPLLGTAFLRASKAIKDKEKLDAAAVADLIDGALEGITARGKATPGEKTMVDAWSLASAAARSAADNGATAAEVLARAAESAEQGAESTIPMVATKGRASYLGERSVGHKDPGATSSALFLKAAADAAKECTAS
ncbi:dihydroxyacetone kinase subunit DhaL [Corynebacterium pseudotuberculosis]|uniref:Dihydroxyacetone kinase subunit L n=1 Tax=Corynebacterium pseudotuberculosis (strain C231) TaxID=681645 RepID=D9QAF6_CORP2|nr:dihydroxyacetone kinase subunit DhaL [Corynebacterium pseudotuberculosis]ADK28856.1 dihydroxyacetone kinase subunit L [Corynebacterium pseudotuberculosis FRC41]ADL10532.1 dihydroxyacetone kinase subunit L [Corynebacterium pseudotuberculosis C231]ADO26331.1 dihydroxyacetone kinase subunit L [Corynebacterium pseudotuberculosis I19]AEK92393.1 Dihydroxyacetone kinase family protein [Corynebacterium pseudotuberculosis PAT10]AEP70306.1 Dihydroxyacetone kinase family protein [Corynebacterium pseud